MQTFPEGITNSSQHYDVKMELLEHWNNQSKDTIKKKCLQKVE